MPLPAFRRRLQGRAPTDQTTVADLQALEDATADVFAALAASPLVDARLVRGVSVSTGATLVAHALNRAPQGFLVVSRTANVQVWRSPQLTATGGVDLVAEARAMRLTADAVAVVDLLVF